MKLPMAVVVSILVSPLATVLAWANILRRRDLTPPHKGLWIVLCLMPTLGPLLYLGIGRGRFELVYDTISRFFAGAAVVLLLVVGANWVLGGSSQAWQITIPSGTILYIPQLNGFLILMLLIVGAFAALEWSLGPTIRRSVRQRHGD